MTVDSAPKMTGQSYDRFLGSGFVVGKRLSLVTNSEQCAGVDWVGGDGMVPKLGLVNAARRVPLHAGCK